MDAPSNTDLAMCHDVLLSLPDGVMIADTDTHSILRANDAACQLTGYTREELKTLSIEDLHFAQDHQLVEEVLARELAGDGPSMGVPFRRADGTRLYIDIHSTVLEMGQQRVIIAVLRDARARLAAERRIVESERAAQAYIDIVTVILLALDTDGNVVMINREGCEILGYDRSEILGKNWVNNFVPEHLRAEIRAVAAGVLDESPDRHEYKNPILTKLGEERMILWRNSIITDESGNTVRTLSSGTDVTERDRIELEMRQLQKMEAIGQLAGGIAHDYNNMLMAIGGCCELLGEGITLDSPLQEELKEIQDCVRRGRELNDQLLTFSKKQVLSISNLDLNGVVAGMRSMLQRLIGDRITVTVASAPEPAVVRGDRARLEQIIMNLGINARDAMPDGGCLDISLTMLDMTERVLPESARPGRYVCLMISDTGCGMTEEQQKHVFEPFYTTKNEAGTGLGLATVYAVSQQLGAFVDLCSAPGEGATFSVYFPFERGEVESTAMDVSTARSSSSGELILIVEDEIALRRIMVRMLESAGYRTLTASDGIEALNLLEVSGEVEAVLSDVMMPGMTGPALAKMAREQYPSLPIVLISGYTGDRVEGIADLVPPPVCLPKPCAKSELLKAVRDALDMRVELS